MLFAIIISLLIIVAVFLTVKKFGFPISKKEYFSKNKLNKNNLGIIEYSSATKETLTILTYNILAQRYMKKKNIHSLKIENRLNDIIKEINHINPEIFCLQEVTFESYNRFIYPKFSDCYIVISYDNFDSYLMNVIGLKKERFDLLDKGRLDIKSLNLDITGNKGVIYTKIQDKAFNNKILYIYNVHFPWMPKYEVEKALIMKLIFDNIIESNNNSVIITGDFNSIPNSLAIRMIYYPQLFNEMKGNYEYYDGFEFNNNESKLMNYFRLKFKRKEKFREKIENLLNSCKKVYEFCNLKSAYEIYRNNEFKNTKYYFLRCHPKFTNYTDNFKETIDYILYSKSFKLLSIGSLPEENQLKSSLPNESFPSDHLKLFAKFEYYD